ncbi:MAG: Ig-like domain-containing protein [Bacteroidota bacterium]
MRSLLYAIPTLLFLIFTPALSAQTSIELDNDTLHLKLDLTRGGAINYISKSGTTRNIVNIHDEGRYIQQSYYAGRSLDRTADGQNPNWSPWSWNPIQVGDSYRNRAEILESSKEGNTLYVKCIPMLWDMNNMPAEAEMEQWTTLEGNVLKVRNRLTCHRTDDLYGEGLSNHQELPAVYPISSLSNLYSYFGALPFTGAPLSNPVVEHLEDGFWGRYIGGMVTESWMAFVDNDQWGMGVYTPITTDFLAGMAGNPGGEALSGSTSYMAPVKTEALYKNSVYEYEYYLVVGSLNQIRSEIYAIKGVQAKAWEFADDLEGWSENPRGGTVAQSEGNLSFTVTGADPSVNKMVGSWSSDNLHYLWLRVKNETAGDQGWLEFFSETGDSSLLSVPLTSNDAEFRDIFVDLDATGLWPSATPVTRFRLHPVTGNHPGEVNIDFIRFLVSKIELRSAGGVETIEGIGESLQLHAVALPSEAGADVEWSVDNASIATISAGGLLTAVAEGVVTVTATAKDGSGDMGTLQIGIEDTGQKNSWEFESDTEGWGDPDQSNGTNSASVDAMGGDLVINCTGLDPYVYSPVFSPRWQVGDLRYLHIRYKNETSDPSGELFMWLPGQIQAVMFPVKTNMADYSDLYVDMTDANWSAAFTDEWEASTEIDFFRLDPIAANGGQTGAFRVDFIRFSADPPPMESFAIEGKDGRDSVGIGQVLQMVVGEREPAMADNPVSWSVDDESIATIDPVTGVLTGVALGNVTVTAVSQVDGSITASTVIRVIQGQMVESVTVSSDLDEIVDVEGSTMQMTATVLPADATNMEVVWSVSPEGFATIDQTGLLTTVSDGVVTVTASSTDGSGVSGSKDISVTIFIQVIYLRIQCESNEIRGLGNTMLMTVTVAPNNATDQTVTWSVDDEVVATIDQTGVLTALTEGEVEVTATANDGSGKHVNKRITVVDNTAVGSNFAGNLKLYPNPASTTLYIDNASQIARVAVVDITGQVIISVRNNGGAKLRIDTGSLASGFYLIRATSVEGDVTNHTFIRR